MPRFGAPLTPDKPGRILAPALPAPQPSGGAGRV